MMLNGKWKPDDYKGYPPYFEDEIEVYDWDGKYLHSYVTDIPFDSFYVSDDDKFLYVVTQDNETLLSEVYRYNLE